MAFYRSRPYYDHNRARAKQEPQRKVPDYIAKNMKDKEDFDIRLEAATNYADEYYQEMMTLIQQAEKLKMLTIEVKSAERLSLLIPGFVANTSVRTLKFKFKLCSDTAVGEKLRELLQVCANIETLSFAGCNLSGSLSFIVAALDSMPRLTTIWLNATSITNEDASAMATFLAGNAPLEKIDMALNNIGNAGIADLAEAMKVNRTVKSLNLSGTQFTAPGATALGEMLCVNSTLELLSILGCSIDENGANGLAPGIQANTGLTHLSITTTANQDAERIITRAIVRNVNSKLTSLSGIYLPRYPAITSLPAVTGTIPTPSNEDVLEALSARATVLKMACRGFAKEHGFNGLCIRLLCEFIYGNSGREVCATLLEQMSTMEIAPANKMHRPRA